MRRAPILTLALLTGACERATAPAEVAAATPVAEPWTAKALASMGERATLIAVVHPQRWATLYPRLLGLVPEPMATYLADSRDTTRWPELVLAALDVPTDAPALKSWDRTRPLVLALAETPHHGPPGTIAASWPLYLRALPGLRHQILVPATDPAALAAALGQQFAALGPTAVTRFAGRATGAWALGEGDWLAVVPEADAVRVVVVRGSLFPEGFFADPARASLRGDLPAPGAVAATAGASVLAGEAHAGVLVRPQRLPALWTWWQARDGLDLIRSAVASQTYLHLRTSLASLSGCEPLYGYEAPEVADYALALTGDDAALRVRAVVSLTTRGAAALDAGIAHAAGPLALLRPDLPMHGWVRFDTTAAQQTLGPPGPPPLTDEFEMAVTECGPVFAMFGPPAAPLGGTRRIWNLLVAGAPKDVEIPAIPTTTILQVALTELSAVKMRGAIAVHDLENSEHAPAINLGPLAAGIEVDLQTRAEAGGTRSLLGFGIDPATVFGAPVPGPVVAQMHLDLATAVPALQPHLPAAAAALQPFSRAELRAVRSGQALDVELVLASGDAPLRALDLSALRWPDPPAPADPTCGGAHAVALRRALELSPPTGARPVEDVLAGLAGLDRALACPSLADQALALRRGATTLVAEGLVELWRTDDAIRVLEGPCAAGDPVLCAHSDRLRAAVVPQLPRVTTSCEGVYPEHFVAVSAAGIALDGVRMTDSSALRTAVADLTRDSEFPVKIGLAFDQRMTLAELAPIFAAVQAPARPPLSILVLAGEAATLRQLAIEPSTQDPGQPDDLDTYLARVDGEQTTLSRMRSPKVPVPAGTELGDARLLVTARRDSPWRVVAAAVARGCGDVRLIDRAAPPRRAP